MKLETILNKGLIIPLNKEQQKCLEEICISFIQDLDFQFVDRLIEVCIIGRNSSDLSAKINEEIKVKLPGWQKIPAIVYPACCLYTLWLAMQDDKVDERIKVGISLMIQNAMLYGKEKCNSMQYMELVPEFYGEWEKYVDGMIINTNLADQNELAKKILLSFDDFMSDCEENSEILRLWALKASREVLQSIMVKEKDHYQVEQDPMKRMVTIVAEWIHLMPCMGTDQEGMRTIKGFFNKEELAKKETMHNILGTLGEIELPKGQRNCMHSSILLYSLENKDFASLIANMELSVIELGIYLYYELILENFVEE